VFVFWLFLEAEALTSSTTKVPLSETTGARTRRAQGEKERSFAIVSVPPCSRGVRCFTLREDSPVELRKLAPDCRFDNGLVGNPGSSRSLVWTGRRPSPSRASLLRSRADRRHRTRAQTPTPAGISSLSKTSPVPGSTRRKSLSLPSHVPSHSWPVLSAIAQASRRDTGEVVAVSKLHSFHVTGADRRRRRMFR
jgi:hypothetical protein